MQLSSSSFADGVAIPGHHAFAVQDPASRIRLSSNRNPQLAWSGAPAGTKSFVLVRHGISDCTAWFAGDKDMAGDYHGYDGPCPPGPTR